MDFVLDSCFRQWGLIDPDTRRLHGGRRSQGQSGPTPPSAPDGEWKQRCNVGTEPAPKHMNKKNEEVLTEVVRTIHNKYFMAQCLEVAANTTLRNAAVEIGHDPNDCDLLKSLERRLIKAAVEDDKDTVEKLRVALRNHRKILSRCTSLRTAATELAYKTRCDLNLPTEYTDDLDQLERCLIEEMTSDPESPATAGAKAVQTPSLAPDEVC